MRLLIVDDDVDIRRSLGQRLEEGGHLVTVESDPDRALQRATAGSFDVILCNVRLPRLDGVAGLDVEPRQQPRHRRDQEARQVRRDLLDHVLRQLGDLRRQHLHLVRAATRLQLPAAAGAAHLDDGARTALLAANDELAQAGLRDWL